MLFHLAFIISAFLSFSKLASASIAPRITTSDAYRANRTYTIRWLADDSEPSASDFGLTTVGLYTGSSSVQTQLQALGNVTDPSKTKLLKVKFDPSVGSNGQYYFLRFQSVSGTTSAGVPLQAFSARFTLSKMTGSLTAAELAEAEAALNSGSVSSAVSTSTGTSAGTSSIISSASHGSASAAVASISGAKTDGTSAANRFSVTVSCVAIVVLSVAFSLNLGTM